MGKHVSTQEISYDLTEPAAEALLWGETGSRNASESGQAATGQGFLLPQKFSRALHPLLKMITNQISVKFRAWAHMVTAGIFSGDFCSMQ